MANPTFFERIGFGEVIREQKQREVENELYARKIQPHPTARAPQPPPQQTKPVRLRGSAEKVFREVFKSEPGWRGKPNPKTLPLDILFGPVPSNRYSARNGEGRSPRPQATEGVVEFRNWIPGHRGKVVIHREQLSGEEYASALAEAKAIWACPELHHKYEGKLVSHRQPAPAPPTLPEWLRISASAIQPAIEATSQPQRLTSQILELCPKLLDFRLAMGRKGS
ncbi:MAG: hypothetical protein CEN89_38 [Candidatus Berkelbacteria bacterium Licking1014_7]|uniref:Uncharacterized protein n=1 Tax=Candidatus Berkelbacteria bacterium Licking1014_7 TaxID=2017147 RepID=A0A554LKV5_9BACT|nr:MAG: hypothetical protein CEN89_38 [Candidatus Berkelbacteria bacterium Licking1014_7]